MQRETNMPDLSKLQALSIAELRAELEARKAQIETRLAVPRAAALDEFDNAAIVGVPHRTLGEEPAAVVTLKPGAEVTEQELRAHVAEHLAAFKVPIAVKFWHETLPRNANGKILKNELKKLFEDKADA